MSTQSLGSQLTVDSPLAVADMLLTAGSALGLLTYVVALLAGNVGVATGGVVLGVGCVIATLTVRSARNVVQAR